MTENKWVQLKAIIFGRASEKFFDVVRLLPHTLLISNLNNRRKTNTQKNKRSRADRRLSTKIKDNEF
jgi:hypothetical protein